MNTGIVEHGISRNIKSNLAQLRSDQGGVAFSSVRRPCANYLGKTNIVGLFALTFV